MNSRLKALMDRPGATKDVVSSMTSDRMVVNTVDSSDALLAGK